MVELEEALTRIAEIRQTMAKAQLFRGYRAAGALVSGLAAFVGAAVQTWWLPRPTERIFAWLILWQAVAFISILAAGVTMWSRYRRYASQLERDATFAALEQFLPAIVAGAMLTVVIVRFARESIWMLPGLWGIVYGLGLFASRKMLPGAMFWVAGFFLLFGCVCLVRAQGDEGLAPWTMGGMFGIGQLLGAIVLYWNLERGHGRE
jgi:hypothetical protein